ncbi:hypothetical protein Afil01_51700 [Actinorhabdospora filicis]|uniref:DoxX family protein n=1 Tax=Actinorhabdospora filicis TaxID=1785913 RepID=A0A9W6WBS2_9ACTN|nr:hypothetical protein Afil01_51700 [Actinorhabdospora filicis]
MVRRLVTVFYWIIALEFLVGAVTKYWPGTGPLGSDYAAKFTGWGYPAWVRFLVGSIELVCAVLLVIPNRRARFLGAGSLVLLLVGAVTTHIVNHDPVSESTAAPLHLVITAVFALVNWPAHWTDLLPGRRGRVGAATGG